MNQMEAGLKHRLRRARRKIASQHLRLRSLHEDLEHCIATRRIGDIRRAADQLLAAIAAHFSMEDGVFFPAMHGLFPQCARELEALVAEHASLLERLERLRAAVTEDTLERFTSAYRSVRESLIAHEVREERLTTSLLKEVEGSDVEDGVAD